MPETPTAETDTEELPLISREVLRRLYQDFSYKFYTYANPTTRKLGFLRYVEQNAYRYNASPKRVPTRTEIQYCSRCGHYEFTPDTTPVAGRQRVCRDCIAWYQRCGHCNRLAATSSFYRTATANSVCIHCIQARFFHCSDCDTYQPNRVARTHRHDNTCCESPAKTFTVPNNGHGPLANDTRAHIQLPAGEISDEGIEVIQGHVRNQMYYEETYDGQRVWKILARDIHQIGNKWQTKDGNYAKRLSRFAYNNHQIKIPPNLMTLVGNAARDHSAAVDHYIEVTRDLNMPAAQFVHTGSCWWSSYSGSRCSLKSHGGFGLRTFADETSSRPTGRAWVLPLKTGGSQGLRPTFNTESAAAFIVFNGYGNLQGYTGARIMSYMAGMTYKKIGFASGQMYINNGGYLIAPEDVISSFTSTYGSLELNMPNHSNLFETESRELANA